ncbi:MAG: hypothetical protein HY074_20530, partial [Deltaproteobacteria bacterium]|nr:hypothetical protein [Deltaproteobacteria bacterium]
MKNIYKTRQYMKLTLVLFLLFGSLNAAHAAPLQYIPRGIGGGGAMSGFSISPYSDLMFVGTDMGTLFRSANGGKTWLPIHHSQVGFDSNLEHAAYVGFNA